MTCGQYYLVQLYSKYGLSNETYARIIGTYNIIIYNELPQIILTKEWISLTVSVNNHFYLISIIRSVFIVYNSST